MSRCCIQLILVGGVEIKNIQIYIEVLTKQIVSTYVTKTNMTDSDKVVLQRVTILRDRKVKGIIRICHLLSKYDISTITSGVDAG